MLSGPIAWVLRAHVAHLLSCGRTPNAHKEHYPGPPRSLVDDLRQATLLGIDLAKLMLAGDASKAPLRRAVELADALARLHRQVEPDLVAPRC